MCALVMCGAASARADLTAANVKAEPGGEWVGVIAARDRSDVLGVWSQRRVRVSRDAGRTFVEQPLDGEIARAAFTRDGVLVTSPASDAGWEGAWAAWVESERFADVAALERLPDELRRAASAFVDDYGIVQTLDGDACSCHGGVETRWIGRVGAPFSQLESWPGDDCKLASGIAPGGWAYYLPDGRDFDAEPRRIVAMDGYGREQYVASATGLHGEADFRVASNGTVTLALFGRRLVRLRGAAFTVLDGYVPEGLTALAVDGAGRALALQRGRILRFAAPGGWRALTP